MINKAVIVYLMFCIALMNCVRETEHTKNDIADQNLTDTLANTVVNNVCHENGKMLFKNNCTSCHAPNVKIIANPFQGIKKAYGLDWCVQFINNNDKLRESGDIRANYIFLLHGKSLMTRFPVLDKESISCILDYVDSFPIVDSNYYQHYKLTEAEMKAAIKAMEKN